MRTQVPRRLPGRQRLTRRSCAIPSGSILPQGVFDLDAFARIERRHADRHDALLGQDRWQPPDPVAGPELAAEHGKHAERPTCRGDERLSDARRSQPEREGTWWPEVGEPALDTR